MKTDAVTFFEQLLQNLCYFFPTSGHTTNRISRGRWVGSRVSIRALIDKKEKFAPKVILTFLLSIAHINP